MVIRYRSENTKMPNGRFQECRIQIIWHVVKTVPAFNQPQLPTDYNNFQNKSMIDLWHIWNICFHDLIYLGRICWNFGQLHSVQVDCCCFENCSERLQGNGFYINLLVVRNQLQVLQSHWTSNLVPQINGNLWMENLNFEKKTRFLNKFNGLFRFYFKIFII